MTARQRALSKIKAEKRSAILKAAKETFFLEGYSGASTNEITNRAGVSKQTVYNHFKSKEELLLTVVEESIAPVYEAFKEELDQSLDLEEWLNSLAVIIIRNTVSPDMVSLARLMVGESLRFTDLAQNYLQISFGSVSSLFRPRFESAIADGLLRGTDVDEVVRRFMDLCSSDLLRRQIFCVEGPLSDASIRKHALNAVEIFLHGFAVSPKVDGSHSVPQSKAKVSVK